jgi:hypothetical protein
MKYDRMSFSTGGLLVNQSVEIVRRFRQDPDWKAVAEVAFRERLLPSRTESAARRSIRELVARLRTLSEEELDLLLTGDRHDQVAILWLAVCRAYPFVGDFAVEVLNERFMSFRGDLGYRDFDSFFDAKAEWHPELADLRPTTRAKLRQVLFRMMREADVLSPDGAIRASLLSPRVQALLLDGNPNELRYFPGAETGARSSLG